VAASQKHDRILGRAKTKPSEAKRFNKLVVSNLSQNREKRSHGDELVFKSIGYGHFRAVFRKVATDEGMLYIADLVGRLTKPSKAKTHKTIIIN